jgi:hypothetical protein
MKEAVIRAIQGQVVDKGTLYRVLEVLILLEEGRLAEAVARVHATPERAMRIADSVIARLREMGYQVHLTRDGRAYLAIILRGGEVLANITAATPDEAFELLEAFVTGASATPASHGGGAER